MAGLQGKVALITAAGQGIGRASALRFLQAGATVYATDVNEEALADLSTSHPRLNVLALDVRKTASVDAVVKKIGVIDILFNCAGFVHAGNILDCTAEDWAFSFDLNVSSMYRTCRAVLPGMVERRRGNIVNMSSVVSSLRSTTDRFVYGTTKAAVIGLTKSIAADFVTQGIRCNALCPGTVDTPSLSDRIAAQGDYEHVRASFIARQPMGRLGTPDEIAAAALFLGSDESSFMTGQTLVVDGGFSI